MGNFRGDILQKIDEIRERDSLEGAKQIYDSISDYLLMKENTSFVIIGDDEQ